GCLHFGTKDDMKMLAETRAKQLRDNYGMANAGVWDPESIGGTHVLYVLHDATRPELYGGLPANPRLPVVYTVGKSILKPIGLGAVFMGLVGIVFHYLGYGPKDPPPPSKPEEKR